MTKPEHSVEFEEAFDTLGVKSICSCGWESRLCIDMNQAHMEWTGHLPADRRIV